MRGPDRPRKRGRPAKKSTLRPVIGEAERAWKGTTFEPSGARQFKQHAVHIGLVHHAIARQVGVGIALSE